MVCCSRDCVAIMAWKEMKDVVYIHEKYTQWILVIHGSWFNAIYGPGSSLNMKWRYCSLALLQIWYVFSILVTIFLKNHIDGLMQKRRNSTANTLQLCFLCIKPSIFFLFTCHSSRNVICHVHGIFSATSISPIPKCPPPSCHSAMTMRAARLLWWSWSRLNLRHLLPRLPHHIKLSQDTAPIRGYGHTQTVQKGEGLPHILSSAFYAILIPMHTY